MVVITNNSIEFRLPKLRYKGNYVDFQRVRGKKSPKIDVVESNNEHQNQKKAAEEAREKVMEEELKGVRAPKWDMLLIPKFEEDSNSEDGLLLFDGFNFNLEEARGVHFNVELPLMATGKFFNLQVSTKCIYLRCGRFYELSLAIPLDINPSTCTAIFNVDTRVLSISCEFALPNEKEEEDEQLDESPTILDINSAVIKEKNIKINSSLLTDLV